MEEQAVAARTVPNLPAKKTLQYYYVFIRYLYRLWRYQMMISVVAAAPHLWMSITFKNEADIIFWTLAKLLVTFQERQYLFAAQCIWWIGAFVQLDPALRFLIDNRELPSAWLNDDQTRADVIEREISSTLRDIQRRSLSEEREAPAEIQYWTDPLRRTRKWRIVPLPTTRNQLKAERKRLLKPKLGIG